MDTLLGISQPQPKKISVLTVLAIGFALFVVGFFVNDWGFTRPAWKQVASLQAQQQNTINTLVKLGQERACKARTFDEAVGVEALVRDTMDAIKVSMPKDASQKIELCAESLRHTEAQAAVKHKAPKKAIRKK